MSRAARPVGSEERGREATDDGSGILVFVYGTLLRGEANHFLLAGADLLGSFATLPAFDLVDLGDFPGLVEAGSRSVPGELYRVDRATLARLDRLEGHPDFFVRTRIRVVPCETGDAGGEADAGPLEVWAYLLPRERGGGAPSIGRSGWRQGQDLG